MYLLIAAAEIQHLDSEFETKGWFASLVASACSKQSLLSIE
jgi:hypothetical protein